MVLENENEEQKELNTYRKIIETANNNNANDKEFSTINDNDSLGYLNSYLLRANTEREYAVKNIYKESIEKLRKVLQNYKILAKELKIDNSLELSHLFTYLLWNGYFSSTNKHIYELRKRLLLQGMHSFDVIKGHGVCLAYSELLSYFLNTCDKKAALLQCKIPTKKNAIERGYTPNIQRNVNVGIITKLFSKSLEPVLKGLTNKFGNHAITLIEDNDKLYIYDSTNLYVLNISGKNKASIINGNGSFELRPLKTLLLSPHADPNNLFYKLVGDEEIKEAFSEEEIKDSYEKTIETASNNQELINDAYDSIHSDLLFINRQTDEIGNTYEVNKIISKKKKMNS